MIKSFKLYDQQVDQLSNRSKISINTINAHSYNMTKTDSFFMEVLLNSDVLIPDGISVVWAVRWLTGQKIKKIAGADLFFFEMNRLQQSGGKCFFLGSSDATLDKIVKRLAKDYPNVKVQTYSPPYKPEFTAEDNAAMLEAINTFQPDVLMVGMTAPKQEKWAYQHYDRLHVGHICCIGAVFDFYAGTINRAPQWMIRFSLEWAYRLLKEPKRMWRRYLIGNTTFIWAVIKEKVRGKKMPQQQQKKSNNLHTNLEIISSKGKPPFQNDKAVKNTDCCNHSFQNQNCKDKHSDPNCPNQTEIFHKHSNKKYLEIPSQ